MANSGASMGTLVAVAVGLLVAGVLSAISAQVISQVGATFTANSVEANITTNANTGQLNLSAQYGLIGTIGGLIVVVALLLSAFGLNVSEFVRGAVRGN